MVIEASTSRRWHPKYGIPFTLVTLGLLALALALVFVAIARAYE